MKYTQNDYIIPPKIFKDEWCLTLKIFKDFWGKKIVILCIFQRKKEKCKTDCNKREEEYSLQIFKDF